MIVMSKMSSRDMKYTVSVGSRNRAWNMDYRLSGRLDLLQPSHSTLWLAELGLWKESQPRRFHLSQEVSIRTKGHLCFKPIHTNDLPVCRPFLFASFLNVTRARECTTAGFLMIRPSRWRRAMFRRELARAISLISLGSNQILRLPHFKTEAARRF